VAAGLGKAQLQGLVDAIRLAVFVFQSDRVVYSNEAAARLVGRVWREYGIDLTITLRNHLSDLRAQPVQLPEMVSLLTTPSGEPFYVHTRRLPAAKGTGVTAVSVRELGSERQAFHQRYGLSRRESQVVDLILHGQSNEEIAATLDVARATVKKHLTRVFDKVGVNSRAKLLSRLA
jgi:DNA-binding CsgD family transcriptional regulator